MTSSPLVSVALAAYNGARFIREQIDSILAQTVRDFELVVCDDCSSDSTPAILREYALRDPRVKVFANGSNLGFKRNFERAIGLCSGEFIALSDQDDVWLPEHLEVLLDNIGEYSMAGGNALLIDANGNESGETLADRVGFDAQRNYKIFYRIFCNSTVFYGHSCLYKTVELRRTLPVPKDIFYHDAWFSACMCVSKNGCVFVNNVVSKYRLHGKNASGSHARLSFFDRVKNFFLTQTENDRIVYCDEILRRFPDLPEKTGDKILEVRDFISNRLNNRHRFRSAKFIIKHYSDIYTTQSKRDLPLRIFSVFFKRIQKKETVTVGDSKSFCADREEIKH